MVYELRPYNTVNDWTDEDDRGVIVWETDEITDASNFRICGKLVSYLGFSDTEFSVPDGITSIGFSVFEKGEWEAFGSPIETIHIPASVRTIEEGAFVGTDITDVDLHPDSPCGMVKDGGLYTKDGKTLLWILAYNDDGEYIVPDGVTRIGLASFRYDMTFVLPSSVTEIGYDEEYSYLFDEVTIKAPEGSYGIQFAKKHGIQYEEI